MKILKTKAKFTLKYKKYLIWPIKYIKHYKSTEYMKRTILSINMIGNEKQKTWQKNTLFTSKMLKGLCSANFIMLFPCIKKTSRDHYHKQYQLTKNLHTIVLSILTKLCKLDYQFILHFYNTSNMNIFANFIFILRTSAKVGTKIEKFYQIYKICITSPNIIPNIFTDISSHPFFIYITLL